MVVTRKIMGPITHSYNRWIIRKLSNWMTPLRFQLTARRCKLSTDLQGDPSKVGRLRVQICPWLSYNLHMTKNAIPHDEIRHSWIQFRLLSVHRTTESSRESASDCSPGWDVARAERM